MLITEEMRLKSKSLTLPVDSSSSSPMVLMAQSGTLPRPSTPHVKSWRPCYNFAKGSYQFSNGCKFVHDHNAKNGDTSGSKLSRTNTTDELLVKLLNKLGLNNSSNDTGKHNISPLASQSVVATPLSPPDVMTRRVLLRCDSTGDLYPIMTPSLIPHALLVSQHTWHQRLGHLGSDVLCHLVPNNVISCNKEKPTVLCHACQLGKHVRLPFISSNTVITSCFDIIHSDVWTSPILSLSEFK
ncbi:ribonuclease H-like domain-containing protein [Tanacetum coccineum]